MAILSNPQKLLTFTGINVFVGDMIRHVTTIDDQIERVVETYAKRVERDAKNYVPVDTGQLKDSITSYRVGKGEWVVEARAPHAIYIEYGTSKMQPQPFMRPALDRHTERFVRALTKISGPVREMGDME